MKTLQLMQSVQCKHLSLELGMEVLRGIKLLRRSKQGRASTPSGGEGARQTKVCELDLEPGSAVASVPSQLQSMTNPSDPTLKCMNYNKL